MKKFFTRLSSGILIFVFAIYFLTISVSSLDFTSSKHPYAVVKCGNYKHIFSTVDYGYSMSRTLVNALKTAGEKADDSRQAYVYVSKGNYTLDHTLKIYSDTTLFAEGSTFTCHRNMLRNGFDSGEAFGKSYNGASNITVIGGTWDMNVDYKWADSVDSALTHSTFRFAHCKNIRIVNCFFKNNYNAHDVEIGGVKNITIDNCCFENQNNVNEFNAVGGKEAVQIDVNTEKAVPYFPEYDYTSCENVTIKNCHFKNKFRGIGSHNGVIGKPYENITICNNTFQNIAGYGIYGIYWNNAEIFNNNFDNVGSGIDIYSVSKISKNLINYFNYSYDKILATVSNSKTYIYGNQIAVRSENNHIKKKFGIRASGSNYTETDTVTNIKKGTYYFYNLILNKSPSDISSKNIISGKTDKNIILIYNKTAG